MRKINESNQTIARISPPEEFRWCSEDSDQLLHSLEVESGAESAQIRTSKAKKTPQVPKRLQLERVSSS